MRREIYRSLPSSVDSIRKIMDGIVCEFHFLPRIIDRIVPNFSREKYRDVDVEMSNLFAHSSLQLAIIVTRRISLLSNSIRRRRLSYTDRIRARFSAPQALSRSVPENRIVHFHGVVTFRWRFIAESRARQQWPRRSERDRVKYFHIIRCHGVTATFCKLGEYF